MLDMHSVYSTKESRLNVIFVTNDEFPESIRIEKEIRTFQKLGAKIKVVAIQNDGQPKIENINGISIFRVKVIKGWLGKLIGAIYKLLFVDISFLPILLKVLKDHSGVTILFVRGIRLVRTAQLSRLFLKNVLLFYDIHDVYHLAMPSYRLRRSGWERFFMSESRMLKLEKWCLKKADRTVLANPPYVDIVCSMGIDRSKSILLPNYEDIEWYDNLPIDGGIVEHYKDKFVVFYVGSFGENRELDVLIKAIRLLRDQIPDLLAVIAGPVSSKDLEQKDRLNKMIQSMNLDSCVKLIGKIEFHKIPTYIKCSHVCTIPLRDCGHAQTMLPHKVFHYMAGAKPIIASNVSEQRRIILDSNCGIVYMPGNPTSLAKCIKKLYVDSVYRSSLGANGRKAVETRFTWECGSRELIDSMKKIPKITKIIEQGVSC